MLPNTTLLSSTLMTASYARSCLEAMVDGRTQPPLTLEAFRAYLQRCSPADAELLHFWEWYRVYQDRFSQLPPIVRCRARSPSELQQEQQHQQAKLSALSLEQQDVHPSSNEPTDSDIASLPRSPAGQRTDATLVAFSDPAVSPTDTAQATTPSTVASASTPSSTHSTAQAHLLPPGSRPRRPPLQEEVRQAMLRWFPEPPATSTRSPAAEEAANGDAPTDCRLPILRNTRRWTVRQWRKLVRRPRSNTAPGNHYASDHRSKSSTATTMAAAIGHCKSADQPFVCPLALPNTAAVQQALLDLRKMATLTTHPDIFHPVFTLTMDHLAGHHLPRFVALLVRNLSPHTTLLRLLIDTLLSLLSVAGIVACLLIGVPWYWRILPLTILVVCISSYLFHTHGICLYRMMRYSRSDSERDNLAMRAMRAARHSLSCSEAGQPFPADSNEAHFVHTTRRQLCWRIAACAILVNVLIVTIILLLHNPSQE